MSKTAQLTEWQALKGKDSFNSCSATPAAGSPADAGAPASGITCVWDRDLQNGGRIGRLSRKEKKTNDG